jgi:heme A synthase
MQYQVPQFIEVEDKIFGPLTAKQFVYVAGGAGFFLALWLLLPLWLAILLGAPVAGLGAALAFFKINERPFIDTLQAAFYYLTRKKLYIWEKKKTPVPSAGDIILASDQKEDPTQFVPAATGSRIKDLAWSLDIKESIYTNKNQQK